MGFSGCEGTVRLLATNYIEQQSSWASDSHLLHLETPCLIIEKEYFVLNLHKPLTGHSS
jgi:hypothetical protein